MNSVNELKPTFLFIYLEIPFLFELKTLVDWTFSQTALDLFQWFRLQYTHCELFIAKCANAGYVKKEAGKKIDLFEKFLCGCCCLFMILSMIVVPLYLFSDLSSELNPVQNAQLEMRIEFTEKSSGLKNSLEIFNTKLVQDLSQLSRSDSLYANFSRDERTKQFDPSQIQRVKMSSYSDMTWDISPPNKDLLRRAIGSENSLFDVNFNTKFTFVRNVSNTIHFRNLKLQGQLLPVSRKI